MLRLNYRGATATFHRYDAGTILKKPMPVWAGNPDYQHLEQENEHAIAFERRVYERLGRHPAIVPYRGYHDPSKGILLREASHGTLQAYIDANNNAISERTRFKFVLEVVEAVVFLHGKGVIHSDLRLENFLINPPDADPDDLHLWLCDFGGSKCDELGPNVQHLPAQPFSDPRRPRQATVASDLFSLGSIIYTLLTGSWPYRRGLPGPASVEERCAYEVYVNMRFSAGQFPNVTDLKLGEMIDKCWGHQYTSANELLWEIKSMILAKFMY